MAAKIDQVSDDLTAPDLPLGSPEVPKDCPLRGDPTLIEFEIKE